MLPQTSWIQPAEPPALKHLAEGGRSENKAMMSGEVTIKKVPGVGALHGTEISEGDGTFFLLRVFGGHALKPFVEWLEIKLLCLHVG